MIIGERTEYKLYNVYKAETLLETISNIERYNHNYTALIMTEDMYEALRKVCNHYMGLDDCNLAKHMPLEIICGLRIYVSNDYCKLIGRDCVAVDKDIERDIIEYLARKKNDTVI